MGSWNETCGYSGLPITDGMKVRYMIVEKNSNCEDANTHALFYPFDLFLPVTPLYKGEYDDYGGINMSSTDEASFWNFLSLVNVRREEVEYHGRIRINDQHYSLAGEDTMWPWMIREDAYQAILNMPLEDDYDEDATIAKYMLQRKREFSSRITEELKLPLVFNAIYTLRQMFTGREMHTSRVAGAILDKLNNILSHRDNFRRKQYQVIPALEDLVEPLHEIENLIVGMSLVRKMLHPTGGAGSQSWNYDAYMHLSEFIHNTALEYCGEEEEE